MDRFSINGKNIIVTGASSGIGRQCAIDFSNYGANIALIGRNEEELNTTKKMCSSNVNVHVYPFDLSNIPQISELIKQICNDMGKLDGLLYAAGIEKTLPYLNLKPETYTDVYNINFVAAMEMVRVLSKKSYRNEAAKFVLISSITASIGRPGVTAYAASKGALISATKTLAIEMASKGLNINCISPGTVLTPMVKNFLETLSSEQQEARKKGFPLGLGMPEDISSTAIFLLSDAARWITGQNIVVDGGYTSL